MTNSIIYRKNQQGVALIVVLLFLILIALAGAMAVRQSNTDLKTATADQINTLLLQSSDSANQRLETIISGGPTTTPYKQSLSVSGLFGFYLNNQSSTGAEYIYCYNPRGTKYLLNNATVVNSTGGVLYNNGGYCDYTNTDDFTSSRKAVMTQMNITTSPTQPVGTAVAPEAFSNISLGNDSNSAISKKLNLDVRSTSILPAFSEPKDNKQACLNYSSIPDSTGKSPMLTCLHTANTPSKMLYQNIVLENVTTPVTCIGAGVGGLTGNTGC